MSYIGAEPTTGAFPFDQFSGNGSTTSFTLTYAPAGATSIIVTVNGVVQNPNLYSVINKILSFSPAPPTGTNNIAVLYLGLPVIGVTIPGNTAFMTVTDFTATSGQRVFTPSGTYTPGFIEVFRNGARLGNADFTATDGVTVTLVNPCVAGDLVTTQSYLLSSLSNALPLSGGTVTGATAFNNTVAVNGAFVSGFTGFKNRIINGGMTIDQRNNGASVNTSGAYPVDRFLVSNAVTSWTAQRSTTAPVGFTNSFLYTSVTGGAAASTDRFIIRHRIEGFNWFDLAWGTASAATATLSFWVRSSLTGTFSGSLRNSNEDRSYPFSFTISAANTYEYKTVTIPGDTTGTWETGNGTAVQLSFDMGSGTAKRTTAGAWVAGDFVGVTGAVSVSAVTGATFYITGVQLERGSNATSFEFRSIGQELQLCQRYFEVLLADASFYAFVSSVFNNTTNNWAVWPFKQTKRASPTFSINSPSAAWNGITPTIYVGLDTVRFAGASGFTGSTGVVGQAFCFANSEL